MRTGKILSILLMLVAPSVVLSQTRGKENGGFILDRHIATLLLNPTATSHGLGKTAAALDEKSVISKLEVFMWQDSTWAPYWVYNVQYDRDGRFSEISRDTFFDGSTYSSGRTVFEYDPENVVTRMLSYRWDSLASGNVAQKYEDYTDFYLNNSRNAVIPFPSLLTLPFTEYFPVASAAFDSVKMFSSIWVHSIGAMMSAGTLIYKFTYDGDSVVQQGQYSKSVNADTVLANWLRRYTYRRISDGRIDTILLGQLDLQGGYKAMGSIAYTYTGTQVTAIGIASYQNDSTILKTQYDLSYTAEGQVGSYTVQQESGASSVRTNNIKVNFTYAKIPVVAVRPAASSGRAAAARWRVVFKRDGAEIAAPEGVAIFRVALCDLRGRQMSTVDGSRSLRCRSVRVPVSCTNPALLVARVDTDCGVYHLPLTLFR